MFRLRANTPRWVVILVDLLLAAFALLAAYFIRFDFKAESAVWRKEWLILSKSLWFYFLVKLVVFYVFKIHKGLVRYTSTEDIRRIFLALLTTSSIFLISGMIRFYFLDGYYLFPMSVLVMEFLLSFALMIGSRFFVKLLFIESNKQVLDKERLLIYGAGISGLITKRTIEKDQNLAYEIIGFIDDNPKMDGTLLEGVRIYSTSKLEKLIEQEAISTVIIAIQQPDENKRKQVVETCLNHDVSVRKVPTPRSWINGEFSTKQFTKVNIEDLLGRKPIQLDEEKIAGELSDKVILVTGAAGSIGSGMVRQIARYQPKQVIVLDQAESPLYDFQNELFSEFPHLNFTAVIADIRHADRIRKVFEKFKPEYVFHAAAYKHVPLMEKFPSEAVLTNVAGTKNLVDLSIEYNVRKFVMISTDKAVNPTNVMGASKRIAEIYAQLADKKGSTRFVTTRFGNVLGSNGSVIPLFQKQIEQGGPITLTDERVTRYFMTIPEACQLVLEAGTMGNGGEIFVFDMGESVKISDLAKKMIRLNGLKLGKDIEIKVVGLRPGEKLYEELLAKDENTIPTDNKQILRAKIREEDPAVVQQIEQLIALFDKQDNDAIVAKMKEIVPEFISNNSQFEKLDHK